MGRQLRTKRAGEAKLNIVGTTGTTAANLANYGYTVLTNTTTGPYILGAPSEGVEKVIVDHSTVAGTVVRATPHGQTTEITIGTGGAYQITFGSTVAQAVTLRGVNSTRWAVVSVYPTSELVPTIGTS